MAVNVLERRTPLKGKGVGLRRTPFKARQVALLPKDGGEKATAAREKARRARKSKKVDLVKRLDMVFSAYIRLRDAMPGGMTRCISCGRLLPFEQMQCGHFFGRRSMGTRWDEDNCNSECAFDNCRNPSHLDGYRANLIAKIGEERFLRLESLHNQERKWSDDELRAAIAHYTAEVRRLSREKGITVSI